MRQYQRAIFHASQIDPDLSCSGKGHRAGARHNQTWTQSVQPQRVERRKRSQRFEPMLNATQPAAVADADPRTIH
jgi:hypothetical protein